MGDLTYSAICSLDGYVEDASGGFEWAAPDEEVHAFVNEKEREVGTYLYGQGMYETMAVWETWDVDAEPAVIRDFAAIWRAADKVVFSRTLSETSTERTRLERELDPAAVRALKDSSERDLGIGGATLAASAIGAGLVDEIGLLLVPVLVGGGKAALPRGVHAQLELREQRAFRAGAIYLGYRVRR
ncbi:MAG TPA: dihydrofolate reductase family protein [Solirubrobacterales bacterium]|nr:dihydrofolate reductase family protein [Solirubrobacterales bacterium]